MITDSIDSSTVGRRVPEGSPLVDLIAALRRRWPILVLCTVIAGASALGFSLSTEETYKSAASLLFRQNTYAQSVLGSEYVAPYQDPSRQGETNLQLVTLPAVARRTAARTALTPAEVQDAVSAEVSGNADVVTVSATAHNPEDAARLANEYATQFIAFRQRANRAQIDKGLVLVRQQLAALDGPDRNGRVGRTLREEAQKLELFSALQTGDVELVQAATAPVQASGPRVKLNTALGLGAGSLIGLGLSLFLIKMDRRVRTPKDIEDVLGLPVLAMIPQSRAMERSAAHGEASAADKEPFRALRTNLRYFNVDRGVRSVLVTSASPADGKSTVAWHLAAVASSAGDRVLLIETDLRRPGLERLAHHGSTTGLSQLLAGQCSSAEAIVRVPGNESDTTSDQPVPHVDVLPAGALPPNPAELLDSERMLELLTTMESHYDLVVLDSPPLQLFTDAVPLVSRVSGTVIVARLGNNTRDRLLDLRRQLEILGAHTFGVVVNGVDPVSTGYYGYGAYR